MEAMLEIIKQNYELEELPTNEYGNIKVSIMKFKIQHFNAKGLGHVLVMNGDGLLGLMKMETLVINPFDIDAPLFSYDRIHVMGNEKLYLELFDTLLEKGYSADLLENIHMREKDNLDMDVKKNWYEHLLFPCSIYKVGKKTNRSFFNELAKEYVLAYINSLSSAKACDSEQKRTKAAEYSNGLLEHGGPSTDVFLKNLGKDKTSEFFKTIFFGTFR